MPERRHAAERCLLLQLSLPCPCPARFIKFRPENLNSKSILVWLFPSSLGNGFCRSGLILHSWVSGLWHSTEAGSACAWCSSAQGWVLHLSVFSAGLVQRKVRLCHCQLCLSEKSVRSSKFDLISFLSGMCTQFAAPKINCAVPIINYPWDTFRAMLTSRSDFAGKFMIGLDELKFWPFNLTCH